jgi:hypothetical protein
MSFSSSVLAKINFSKINFKDPDDNNHFYYPFDLMNKSKEEKHAWTYMQE